MLIFDGYRSHLTQEFLDFCWQHHIQPFQLPANYAPLTASRYWSISELKT